MMQEMREQEPRERIVGVELGDNPDDKAGGLMVQSLTTLVNRAVFQAQSDDDVDIEEVRKLARAAKDAIQARRASLDERQQIKKIAREEMLAEQKEKIAEKTVKDGVTEVTMGAIQ